MSENNIRYIGESRDGRTNRWRITCPECGEQFVPPTTRLSTDSLTCPNRKCGVDIFVDYNNEKVSLNYKE